MGRRSTERLFFVEYPVPPLLRALLDERANHPGKYADALINGFSRKARMAQDQGCASCGLSLQKHAVIGFLNRYFRPLATCRSGRLSLTEASIDIKSPPQKISLHSEKELRCNG